MIDAFNMPMFEAPGFEADDVLGTLAKQAKAQGVAVTIVTLDTDLLQLVEPGVDVFLYRPYMKGAAGGELRRRRPSSSATASSRSRSPTSRG